MSDLWVVYATHHWRRSGARFLARWWRNVVRRLRWGSRRTSPEYDAFMASSAWRVQRARVLRRDGSRCRWCGAKGREVHHLWYARPSMKDTPDTGLVSLCEPCHRETHRDKRSAPTSRRLW